MGMTVWRWGACVGLICAVIGAVLLPFPTTTPQSWASNAPPALTAEIGKLTDAAARAQAAVRSYRSLQALDRWSAARARSDTTPIRVETSVPTFVATAARTIVADQWAALGPRASAAHAEVFIYIDSTTIPRVSDVAAKRRVLEPRRFVDVTFALPQATDGERCVALVRVRGVSPAHITALHQQSLIGVCGFFATFGLPGEGIRPWLSATSYRFARHSDWAVARAPAIDASSLYGLGDAGGLCLTGSASGCLDALGVKSVGAGDERPGTDRLAWVMDAATSTYATSPRARPTTSLGAAEDGLLADAVRSIGPDRFAEFWRSGSRPDAAFLASTGTSLDSWAQQWLTRTYGSVGARPTVRVRDVVWLAMAAPLLLVAAARPRERVLAESR
jgi:hypothetical protein